jgi:hypothetical protein
VTNDYVIDGDTVRLYLNTREGNVYEALFDLRDLPIISLYRGKWRLHRTGTLCYVAGKKGKGITEWLLHRWLMRPQRHEDVDHINGNGLDNRRCNLRIADRYANAQNQREDRRNSSGYRNVSWASRERKWCVQAAIRGKHYHIGYFVDLSEAVTAAREFRSLWMPFDARRPIKVEI